MKRVIKFSSIEQFRSVIHNVKLATANIGYDKEKQEPIYDPAPIYPIITAQATEKIHGTCGAICFSNSDGFWVQSKNNILEIGKDNADCAGHALKIENEWKELIFQLADNYDVDLNTHIISIYFEWCGSGIQANTAVSGIDKKMAMIFSHFKISPIEADVDIPSVWKETNVDGKWISNHDVDIYNINDFPTYEFKIDFAQPLMIQNDMINLVENTIEPASPVGKKFGKEKNIGEGIVVTFMYKDVLYRFKVKGSLHAGTSKIKKLKKVDNVKLQKIRDMAQTVTPVWRLQQMFDEANDVINGGIPKMENMGAFMKLVNTDIIKEETDIINEADLIPKDIFRDVGNITRPFYKQKLDELVFGKN